MNRISIPNLCLLLVITTTLGNITAFSQPSSYTTGSSISSSRRHDLNLLPRSDRDGINDSSKKQQGKVHVNNVVDDIWTNADNVDKNNNVKKSQKLQIIGTIIGSDNNTNNTSNTNTLEETSIDSTKWILIGGTVLILIAAGALSVTIGNDLGINLELG